MVQVQVHGCWGMAAWIGCGCWNGVWSVRVRLLFGYGQFRYVCWNRVWRVVMVSAYACPAVVSTDHPSWWMTRGLHTRHEPHLTASACISDRNCSKHVFSVMIKIRWEDPHRLNWGSKTLLFCIYVICIPQAANSQIVEFAFKFEKRLNFRNFLQIRTDNFNPSFCSIPAMRKKSSHKSSTSSSFDAQCNFNFCCRLWCDVFPHEKRCHKSKIKCNSSCSFSLCVQLQSNFSCNPTTTLFFLSEIKHKMFLPVQHELVQISLIPQREKKSCHKPSTIHSQLFFSRYNHAEIHFL